MSEDCPVCNPDTAAGNLQCCSDCGYDADNEPMECPICGCPTSPDYGLLRCRNCGVMDYCRACNMGVPKTPAMWHWLAASMVGYRLYLWSTLACPAHREQIEAAITEVQLAGVPVSANSEGGRS